MIKGIKKRDGRIVDYDSEKIANAIFLAAQKVGGNDMLTARRLSIRVSDIIMDLGIEYPDVEEVQDIVEKVLIEEGHAKTAKEYILYRADRTKIRERETRLMNVFKEITFLDSKNNDVKRENANIDGDTAMGTMLKYGSEAAKEFYSLHVLNEDHSRAHQNGDIHIHDLDFLTLTLTCCQIDIIKLFEGGFSTGHGHLREPQDVQSYAALAAIAIQANQNDQHGGQSIPNFDYGIAKGVAKTYKKIYISNIKKALELIEGEDKEDKIKEIYSKINPSMAMSHEELTLERELLLEVFDEANVDRAISFATKNSIKETDKRTYQAMEAFVHNLNTMHSRAGAQVPFSSINFGTDTSLEGRMVIKNLLLATEAGLGNGETPIFPILVFKISKGVSYDKEDPNYDLFKLAMRVSAKRLFPNFSFLDAPFNKPYLRNGLKGEVAYMGCRTRVIANSYDKDQEITYGRGNLSFTSVNLPRLAILAQRDEGVFMDSLDSTMDIVIDQLLERLAIQSKRKVRNYPFLMGQGVWLDSDKLKQDDEIGEVIKHGTLSMGFIGLAEAVSSLCGEHHGESDRAQELGLRIIKRMRARLDKESEARKLNFSLLATPAEGLSGRFVRMDKERFGVIKGVTDKDYYTNSFHVPVGFKINAIDKIKIEAPYHALTNAGHISYVELDGDPTNNLEAFEQLVRAMYDEGIGYGSINHPVDRDPYCGFTGIIRDICPGCGRKETELEPFERIRRITGYLVGDMERWNNAKKSEEKDRIKHI